MCYSLKASFNSFIINIVSCYVLLYVAKYKNKETTLLFHNLSLFFMFVGLMQLYDLIFWISLRYNRGKNTINYLTTKIAMLSNHLQPIILAYLISRVYPLGNVTKYILTLYICICIWYSYTSFINIDYTRVTNNSFPALDWKWNNLENAEIFYAFFLVTFSFATLNLRYPFNILMLIINIFTFTFSFYNFKRKTVGHMWCKIAAYVPFFLLLLEVLFEF